MSPPKTNKSVSRVVSWYAKQQIRVINEALETFPLSGKETTSTADFNKCSRSFDFEHIGFFALTDGIAVTYTTEGFLADYSHRFVFPRREQATYHRESFHVDAQCIPAPALNLHGPSEIAGYKDAHRQLSFVGANILENADLGWTNLSKMRVPLVSC